MTFVGKILVIVIMAFALLFLGISTVVFTTHTNWKQATDAAKKQVTELTGKTRDLTAAVDAAKKDLDKARVEHKAAIDQSEAKIKTLQDEIQQSEKEISAARSKLEVAQQSANTALAEA